MLCQTARENVVVFMLHVVLTVNHPLKLTFHASSWHLCQGADNVMAGAAISAGTTRPRPCHRYLSPLFAEHLPEGRTLAESAALPSVWLVLILNNLQNVLQGSVFESRRCFLFSPSAKLQCRQRTR